MIKIIFLLFFGCINSLNNEKKTKKETLEEKIKSLKYWIGRGGIDNSNIGIMKKFYKIEEHLDEKILGKLLIIAINTNNIILSKFLMEKRVDLNLRNKEGDTALTSAVRLGYKEIVKLLKEKNVNIDLKRIKSKIEFGQIEYKEQTPLELSLRKNHLNIANFLISKDAKITNELIIAIILGHKKIAYSLLKKDIDLNYIYNDTTALIEASKKGYKKLIKILIEKGVNLNLSPNLDITALMYSVLFSDIGTTKILIGAGANIYDTDLDGYTALSFAIKMLNLNAIDLILSSNSYDHRESCEIFKEFKHLKSIDVINCLIKTVISFKNYYISLNSNKCFNRYELELSLIRLKSIFTNDADLRRESISLVFHILLFSKECLTNIKQDEIDNIRLEGLEIIVKLPLEVIEKIIEYIVYNKKNERKRKFINN